LETGKGSWNDINPEISYKQKDDDDDIVQFLKQQLREKDKIIQHLMNNTSKPTLQGGL
jgi:glutamine amidotransferase-like uncharacterized protein